MQKYNSILISIFLINIIEAKFIKTKVEETAEEKFRNFNLTKRPLNLYIIENGKHVPVYNKSLEEIIPVSIRQAKKFLTDYRIGRPPFLIKTRGTILLLHNNTGKCIILYL